MCSQHRRNESRQLTLDGSKGSSIKDTTTAKAAVAEVENAQAILGQPQYDGDKTHRKFVVARFGDFSEVHLAPNTNTLVPNRMELSLTKKI
mmetsp:Transcript_3940/g.6048  ORF Transcript_3940/g.6048 Transcript_3940/m.6048 type:complete len:91 (-) Transcript_3940:702-974(-)